MDPRTASLGDVIKALNGFYSNYLERCIRENEEFAQGAEADCCRENCQSNDKVSFAHNDYSFLEYSHIFLQVILTGYQGVAYPSLQAERNALFKPLVQATITQVLKREVGFTVHGRNGEVRRNTLPPVEVKFTDGAEVAEEFRRGGSKLSKERQPGVAHLYFNSCTTLATRVRIEVLRAIGNRISTSQRTAYCVATQAKPYLSVGPASGATGGGE